MHIEHSKTPAEDLTQRITYTIDTHEGDVLCLLAGGSALEVYKYINLTPEQKVRTICCMGDERWSREKDINNYLQLTAHNLLSQLGHVVDTSVHENEPLDAYTNRLNSELESIIDNSKNLKIISILGVGTDGHTAGIFPMAAQDFSNIYKADLGYVSVPNNELRIDPRASLTPGWILANTDKVYVYVTGTDKKSIMKKLIQDNNIEMHDMPIQLIKQHDNAFIYTDIDIDTPTAIQSSS